VKRVRRGLLWLSILGLASVALIATAGRGGESQFNPATLECRGVADYYIPYTLVRVWSRPGEPYRPRIAQFWLEEGYARAGEPGGRWDTVTGWGGRWLRTTGDAKLFWYHASCASDEQAEEWIAWSRRHPDLAADLWPRVVGLLRQAGGERSFACYGAAAELMVRVRGAEDAKEYGERVALWHEWTRDLGSE
jgi:hypothetical protein